MKSKKTWSRPGSSINMNYDLFLTSDGVNPDGNLEIKTATDPTNGVMKKMVLLVSRTYISDYHDSANHQ